MRSAELTMLALGALLAACTSQPDPQVGVGELAFDGQHPSISVPSSASVGTPITISITTVGNGCTYADSTKVTTLPEGFEVTPYDRTTEPGPWPQIAKPIPHDATVTFDTAGMHLIQVIARAPEQLTGFTYQVAVQ